MRTAFRRGDTVPGGTKLETRPCSNKSSFPVVAVSDQAVAAVGHDRRQGYPHTGKLL
jgi:hypothetical protein